MTFFFHWPDLVALRTLLERALHSAFNPAAFTEVAALASRLIARRTSSFRAQHGFKLMRKTNIAMCRLHECNVSHILNEFLGTLPAYRLGPDAPLELPTRDNFDYVLVRLQSLGALLLRIARTSRQASELFVYYLQRGFFLETAVLHVGVLSQIWLQAQRMCAATVELHDALRLYARHFGDKQKWLIAAGGQQMGLGTGDTTVPKLVELLGEDWQDECVRAARGARVAEQSTFGSDGMLNDPFGFGGRNDENADCIVDVPADVVESTTNVAASVVAGQQKKPALPKVQIAKIDQTLVSVKSGASALLLASADIGVAIERKSVHQPGKIVDCKMAAQRLEKLVNADDVQSFVKAERIRLTATTAKASERVSAERWKELQRKVNQILVTTQGRNTVTAFRKYWAQTVLKLRVQR